jgi:hypothetical protein
LHPPRETPKGIRKGFVALKFVSFCINLSARMLTSDYRKGEIPRPAQSGVEDLDDDLDSKIDSAIKQVWEYYDKKGEGKGRENSGR